jgi:hypothetical protein
VYVPFATFAFIFYEYSTGPGFAWTYATCLPPSPAFWACASRPCSVS